MAKLDVTVSVEKETYELGQAVAGLVLAIKAKAKDGLNLGEVVAALSEEMGVLVKGVMGLDQVPAEAVESPGAMARAIALPLTDVLEGLLKKEAPAAAPAEVPAAPAEAAPSA